MFEKYGIGLNKKKDVREVWSIDLVQQSHHFIQDGGIVAVYTILLNYLCTQKHVELKIEKYEEVFNCLLHDGCINDSICTVYSLSEYI